MTAHALLSPSAAHRWIPCTRAPRYEEQFPEPPPSPYAQEGQYAHALAEQELARHLGRTPKAIPAELLQYDSAELRTAVADYVQFAVNVIEEARSEDPQAVVLLEEKAEFPRFVPEGRGTLDLGIAMRGRVIAVDAKFGAGVRVDAEANPQLRLYCLGLAEMFRDTHSITSVETFIAQPRLHHISKEALSINELYGWATEIVKPAATLAWEGQGLFVPGDHCRWCRGKAVCAARAQHHLQLARFDFAEPETLDETAIAHVLEKAARLRNWVADVETYALQQALRGRKFPSYKLVAGRGSRKFVDPTKAAQALLKAGVDADLVFTTPELKSVSVLEDALGKKKFAQLVSDLVVLSPGKPTLVPVEDRRPEITPTADAAADPTQLVIEGIPS